MRNAARNIRTHPANSRPQFFYEFSPNFRLWPPPKFLFSRGIVKNLSAYPFSVMFRIISRIFPDDSLSQSSSSNVCSIPVAGWTQPDFSQQFLSLISSLLKSDLLSRDKNCKIFALEKREKLKFEFQRLF